MIPPEVPPLAPTFLFQRIRADCWAGAAYLLRKTASRVWPRVLEDSAGCQPVWQRAAMCPDREPVLRASRRSRSARADIRAVQLRTRLFQTRSAGGPGLTYDAV